MAQPSGARALKLEALPDEVRTLLLLLLPLDTRLRCAEVCRSWRAMLAERSLWMHLDVSPASGLGRASDALLRAAARRALRNVKSINVSGALGVTVSYATLREVLAQNVGVTALAARCADDWDAPRPRRDPVPRRRKDDEAAAADGVAAAGAAGAGADEHETGPGAEERTLERHLAHVFEYHACSEVEALLAAAPRLRALDVDVSAASSAAARSLLATARQGLGRAQPLALRIRRLQVCGPAGAAPGAPLPPGHVAGWAPPGQPPPRPYDGAALAALLADVAAHGSVTALSLHGTDSGVELGDSGALDAAVDAMLAMRLQSLSWRPWPFVDGGGAALVRLLSEDSGHLRELRLQGGHLAGRDDLNALCDALRASRLTHLTLRGVAPAEGDAMTLAELATALTDHPTLQHLALSLPVQPPTAPLALALAHAHGFAHAHAMMQQQQLVGLGFGLPPSAAEAAVRRYESDALGDALGALVAANAAALTSLDVGGVCAAGEEAHVLGPLAAALPANAHLRALRCDASSSLAAPRRDARRATAAFVAHTLAPAVHANTSLRTLHAHEPHALAPCAADADAHEAVQQQLVELERCVYARAEPRPADRADDCAEFVLRPAHVAPALQPALAAALRANARLRCVVLSAAAAAAAGADARAACAACALLRDALTCHATLAELRLCGDWSGAAAAVGAALGELVAADAPALTALRVRDCALGDAGVAHLLAALPRNAHLRQLDLSGNGLSAAAVRDALLPAVRANASLRHLACTNASGFLDAQRATEHVAQRAQSRASE